MLTIVIKKIEQVLDSNIQTNIGYRLTISGEDKEGRQTIFSNESDLSDTVDVDVIRVIVE